MGNKRFTKYFVTIYIYEHWTSKIYGTLTYFNNFMNFKQKFEEKNFSFYFINLFLYYN